MAQQREPLVLVSDLNGIRTVKFNNPAKLNGWSPDMTTAIREALEGAAKDDSVKATIVTGSGKYYCAGVDFAGSLQPMRPSILKEHVRQANEALFGMFINFPKPLFCAMNGPAIGAAATSATICDQIIASETASILTPFKALGVVPEGCSSYNFPRWFGEKLADEILSGKKLDANQAKELGIVSVIVPVDQLQETAQRVAEEWVSSGRKRVIEEQGLLQKYNEVNARESVELAEALVAEPFLNHMVNFTYAKGKYVPFVVFWIARFTRPLWSNL